MTLVQKGQSLFSLLRNGYVEVGIDHDAHAEGAEAYACNTIFRFHGQILRDSR